VSRRMGVLHADHESPLRAKYGGMTVCEAHEKRHIEAQNRNLRALVAQHALEKESLRVALGKVVTTSVRRDVVSLFNSRGLS
jgi:hypothetical protein